MLNTSSNANYKIFNAYYDTRDPFKHEPVIRILIFLNRVDPDIETFCQIWYKDLDEPLIVRPFEIRLMWNKDFGVNRHGSSPYMIGCKNPYLTQVPLSVSLVENECDEAINNLPIIYNLVEEGQKKQFGVVVKDLYYPDDESMNMKIIEWIEIILLLGANKIFFYILKIHENILNTLKYYEMQGKVKIEWMSKPKGLRHRNESLTQQYQNEMISLNDCLYKNMYEYEYLIPLDTDEIIVPKREEDMTWTDLISRIDKIAKQNRNESYATYTAKTAFFLLDNNHHGEVQSEVPENMHFLQNVYRSTNSSRSRAGSKSFQKSELVLTIHNHRAMHCIGREVGDANLLFFLEEDARLHHYRNGCVKFVYSENECIDFINNTVKDTTLWKYKDELLSNINITLNALETF